MCPDNRPGGAPEAVAQRSDAVALDHQRVELRQPPQPCRSRTVASAARRVVSASSTATTGARAHHCQQGRNKLSYTPEQHRGDGRTRAVQSGAMLPNGRMVMSLRQSSVAVAFLRHAQTVSAGCAASIVGCSPCIRWELYSAAVGAGVLLSESCGRRGARKKSCTCAGT